MSGQSALQLTMRPGNSVSFRIYSSQLVFMVAAIFLWSRVLEAPLRYGLDLEDMDDLIYLPKLLLLLCMVILPLLRSRASAVALWVSGLLVLYLLWGMVNLSSHAQAQFGLWVLVPLLFGLWAGPLIRLERWRRLFTALFVAAALGLFLNPMLHYPWSGQSTDLFGHTIAISRQWAAFGIERYAGFARASFSTASQLLLFAILLVVLLEQRGHKLLIWLVAGAGIALTTSKGPLGAWLLLSAYFAGGKLLCWPKYWIQLWLGLLALVMSIMIFLPLSTLLVDYDPNFYGFAANFLFHSFGERLNWMWPDSFHLLNLHGTYHWWVGRGLGGIGAAQHYFEPARYFAGDNFFVYVTVAFGFPVAIGLLAALWIKVCLTSLRYYDRNYVLPMMLCFSAYGIVVNLVEEPVLSFALGVVIGQSVSIMKWRRRLASQ